MSGSLGVYSAVFVATVPCVGLAIVVIVVDRGDFDVPLVPYGSDCSSRDNLHSLKGFQFPGEIAQDVRSAHRKGKFQTSELTLPHAQLVDVAITLLVRLSADPAQISLMPDGRQMVLVLQDFTQSSRRGN